MAKLVTISEAAEFLGCTEDDVLALIGTGELDATIDLTDESGPETISHLRISSSVLSAYRQADDLDRS
jgi:hypothetical protein